VAIGSEATTSSDIEEMIQELAQPEGLEVPATGMLRESVTTVTREPSSQSSLPKVLLSSDPQLGKRIKMCPYTPIFIVIASIEVMIVESTGLAQVEDPVASTSVEDSALQTSVGEPSAMEFVAAPAASGGYHNNGPEGVGHDFSVDRTCCWPCFCTK